MEQTKQQAAPVRPKRKGTRKGVGARDKFAIINKDPEKSYRLINADNDRIQEFEDSGWTVERIKDHLRGGLRADNPAPTDNTLAVGGGQRQVLVSIEKEFYDEDQETKAKLADAKEAGIKANISEGQYGEVTITKDRR